MAKKLYRSKKDRVIAGICGGIGNHSGMDPTIIRLLFVLGAIVIGVVPGILAYLIAWIIIPEEK